MTTTLDWPRWAMPEVAGDLTRRELIGGAVAAGLLAACGNGSGSDQGAGQSTATAAKTTRSFVDARGVSVEVPDRPQRIVALHDINAGAHLLSLGAPVVGIAERSRPRADMTRYFDLSAIPTVGLVYEPNVEAIAAARPDLIVGEGFNNKGMFTDDKEATQRALDAIAPVVFVDTFRPPEAVMADFARLIGPAATASVDQQRAELDELVGKIKALLGSRWGEVTASWLQPRADSVGTSGARALAPTDILTRVGVKWFRSCTRPTDLRTAGR